MFPHNRMSFSKLCVHSIACVWLVKKPSLSFKNLKYDHVLQWIFKSACTVNTANSQIIKSFNLHSFKFWSNQNDQQKFQADFMSHLYWSKTSRIKYVYFSLSMWNEPCPKIAKSETIFCDTGREPFDERIFQALFKCMNNMCINAILSTHLFSMTAVRIAVRASIFPFK